MRRRQVTYARKRRNRYKAPAETNSSPLQDIIDPEQKISHSEMSRRMLKRSRRSGSGTTLDTVSDSQGQNSKKLRMSPYEGPEPTDKTLGSFPLNHHNYDTQTPHPTLLTESQIFKLESSRGLPLSPDHEFSPVPLAQPPGGSPPTRHSRPSSNEAYMRQNSAPSRRTSSSNLKENANRPSSKSRPKSPVARNDPALPDSQRSIITRSKLKYTALKLPLASPFTSKPASPYVSPKISSPHDLSMKPRPKITKVNAMKAKRTLSDTHYNPNLLSHAQTKIHAQSTVNSPTRTEKEIVKIRRPSAPSATAYRPDVASWFVSSNSLASSKQDSTESGLDRPPLDGAGRAFGVDFNRPPSQLSYSSTYDEDFFGDALGISTPFGLKTRAGGQALLFRAGNDSLESTDSEGDDEVGNGRLRYMLHSLTRPSKPGTPVKNPLSEKIKSPWLSDSLISPPTACLEHAYSKSSPELLDGGVDEDASMGNDAGEDTLGLNSGPPFELALGLGNADRREAERAEDLKELFDSLDISFGGCPRPNILRARSLDLERNEIPALHSPARISPTKAKNSNDNANIRGGRDRRGTIRASDFQTKHLTETSMMGGGGGARRTRSGTIIGPAGPRRDRSGTIVARPSNLMIPPRNDVDVDMPDADVLPQGNVHGDIFISEVDDFEDEMLLNGHWHDEDWVVADPPSPVVPRRDAKKRDWKKEWEKEKKRERRQRKLGKSTGSWGMSEHDEDDGEDDPLDLFK